MGLKTLIRSGVFIEVFLFFQLNANDCPEDLLNQACYACVHFRQEGEGVPFMPWYHHPSLMNTVACNNYHHTDLT